MNEYLSVAVPKSGVVPKEKPRYDPVYWAKELDALLADDKALVYRVGPARTTLRAWIERAMKERGLDTKAYKLSVTQVTDGTRVCLLRPGERDVAIQPPGSRTGDVYTDVFVAQFMLDVLDRFDRALQESKRQAQLLLGGSR